MPNIKHESRFPALVDTGWLAEHSGAPGLEVLSVAARVDAERRGRAIPGSRLTHWRDFYWDDRIRDFASRATLDARLSAIGIDADTHVVLSGEPTQFGFYAWWALRYAGRQHVSVLDGGLKAWEADGREVATVGLTDPDDSRSDVERAPWRKDARINREEILARLEDDALVVIDGRSADEYSGRVVGGISGNTPNPGPERAGHIPGARLLAFADLLDENGRLRPLETLRKQIQAVGLSAEQEVAVYCRTGHRSSLIFFVLSQLFGFERIRLYDGSWTEWGVLVGAPIAR